MFSFDNAITAPTCHVNNLKHSIWVVAIAVYRIIHQMNGITSDGLNFALPWYKTQMQTEVIDIIQTSHKQRYYISVLDFWEIFLPATWQEKINMISKINSSRSVYF